MSAACHAAGCLQHCSSAAYHTENYIRQARCFGFQVHLLTALHCRLYAPQGAKIFGDGVWFKTNAAALTDEGANILGFGFGFGNNLPCEPTVQCCAAII